jgi:hypothetical protein
MKFEIHWSHFIILAALGKKVFCDDYIDLTTSGDNEITGISFVLTPGNPPPVLHGQLFWGHTLYEKYFDRDTLYAERDASRFATAIVAGKSTWLPCISKDPTNVNKCPPDDRPQCEAPPGKWLVLAADTRNQF